MPSQDTFHQEQPETNRALFASLSAEERQRVIGKAVSTRGTSLRGKAAQAAHLQALAVRLGVDAEVLAEKIPEDTLNRLKYPMLEQEQEDGTRQYVHDVGIMRDARRSLLATDHSEERITQNAPAARDERGKFIPKK